MSTAAGVLGVALTYALARRLFGASVGFVAAALMAVSFWPVMYARFGLRQIGLLPWMLGAYYAATSGIAAASKLPNSLTPPGGKEASAGRRITVAAPAKASWSGLTSRPRIRITRQAGLGVAGGVCLAGALMTYFAGRVVPVVILAFGAALLPIDRERFRRSWRLIAVVLVVGLSLAAPMFAEIGRLAPGGEQRLEIVGPQLSQLLKGNLQPAIDTAIGTLGMFTFRGDPEALYNVEGRPVFDWLTGAFLYAGLAIAVWNWRRAAYAFTLIAFVLGIAPAFVSNPPASFSHTIAAMPIVYMLTAVGLVQAARLAGRWRPGWRRAPQAAVALAIVFNAALTLRDYFGEWTGDAYVRFLYHAPTRAVAGWLNETPGVADIAIATHPSYLWLDPGALRLDLTRGDVRARWFDPASAVVYPAGSGLIAGTALNAMGVDVLRWPCCPAAERLATGAGFAVWRVSWNAVEAQAIDAQPAAFEGSLTLLGMGAAVRPNTASAEDGLWLSFAWRVDGADLPPTLKFFVHLVDAEGRIVSQFDGMGAFPPSLRPGDRLAQTVQLARPEGPPQDYALRAGVYDAATGARWRLPDGREYVTLSLP